MPKQNPLLNIVKKQKEGKAVAIYSCCSSNAFVIELLAEGSNYYEFKYI